MMRKVKFWERVFGALTLLSGVAFANNLWAIARWWKAFADAGGESAQMAAVRGPISLLEWSVVDYSGVTTLIPLIGFCCCWRGLRRLRLGLATGGAEFPFFKGSDQLHIALGLFGTLWGIIVIGYYRLESVTMADLMQCLHTALFSTLTAVVWVFFADRPLLRPWLQRLRAEIHPYQSPRQTLTEAVETLLSTLHAGAKELEEDLRRSHDAFCERQARIEETFAGNLATLDRELQARQTRAQEQFDAHLNTLDAALSERLAATHSSLQSTLQTASEALAALQSRLAAELDRRLDQSEQAAQARHKELVATFAAELDLLKERLAREQDRSETLSAKLQAVSQALR